MRTPCSQALATPMVASKNGPSAVGYSCAAAFTFFWRRLKQMIRRFLLLLSCLNQRVRERAHCTIDVTGRLTFILPRPRFRLNTGREASEINRQSEISVLRETIGNCVPFGGRASGCLSTPPTPSATTAALLGGRRRGRGGRPSKQPEPL